MRKTSNSTSSNKAATAARDILSATVFHRLWELYEVERVEAASEEKVRTGTGTGKEMALTPKTGEVITSKAVLDPLSRNPPATPMSSSGEENPSPHVSVTKQTHSGAKHHVVPDTDNKTVDCSYEDDPRWTASGGYEKVKNPTQEVSRVRIPIPAHVDNRAGDSQASDRALTPEIKTSSTTCAPEGSRRDSDRGILAMATTGALIVAQRISSMKIPKNIAKATDYPVEKVGTVYRRPRSPSEAMRCPAEFGERDQPERRLDEISEERLLGAIFVVDGEGIDEGEAKQDDANWERSVGYKAGKVKTWKKPPARRWRWKKDLCNILKRMGGLEKVW